MALFFIRQNNNALVSEWRTHLGRITAMKDAIGFGGVTYMWLTAERGLLVYDAKVCICKGCMLCRVWVRVCVSVQECSFNESDWFWWCHLHVADCPVRRACLWCKWKCSCVVFWFFFCVRCVQNFGVSNTLAFNHTQGMTVVKEEAGVLSHNCILQVDKNVMWVAEGARMRVLSLKGDQVRVSLTPKYS